MNYFLLSFDVEEFDTPLEYGKNISMEDQFKYSHNGLVKIKQLLEKQNITATFFTTANFALRHPKIIKELSLNHEIASHGFYHSKHRNEDLLLSKQTLEEITGKTIHGYRMPRMMNVDNNTLIEAGYTYNASLHPTFIPGRYNHLRKPRTPFIENNLLQIPASVTPLLRFPIFWLSFKNFPLSVLKRAIKNILKKDQYANTYFHPWEFSDIKDKKTLGLPRYISNVCDDKMLHKLDSFILWAKEQEIIFKTYSDYADLKLKELKI